MVTAGTVLSRTLYGAVFVVIVPAGLVLWDTESRAPRPISDGERAALGDLGEGSG